MNQRHDHNSDDPRNAGVRPDAPGELDVLIGRIVDGEASPLQRQRFETLAGEDPGLWRRLALRQQDMAMLAVHVEPSLNAAEKIELPSSMAPGHGFAAPVPGGQGAAVLQHSARGAWWLAASGWAALVMFATAWGAGVLPSATHLPNIPSGPGPDSLRLASMPPEQHLSEYMQAPYVMGEMPPTLLQVDELSDGRLAVSYLRRIVEVQYYNSPEDIPLDENGLSSSPRELRSSGDKRHPAPGPRD